MRYLESIDLVGEIKEEQFFGAQRLTCYDSFHPFGLFPGKGLSHIEFSDITIFYGGNGTGKSTLLNVIASKIGAERRSFFNKSNFWDEYIEYCEVDYENRAVQNKRIITSDDVFDYMLDVRAMNQNIDNGRIERFSDFAEYRHKPFRFESLDQLDELRKINMARSKSKSQYVRSTLTNNVREYSNGESAFMYFSNNIRENGIYILDEPENSLSPEKQIELIKFLEDSSRFFHCQFIISTHSPFILSMRNALIYDMDQVPVCQSKWTELKNVRMYYDFFKQHEDEF